MKAADTAEQGSELAFCGCCHKGNRPFANPAKGPNEMRINRQNAPQELP
jgi:hypothetical protein